MARIRHIAIATRDLEATTQFYIEGLGLKQVGKINTPTSEGYYLTDGHVTSLSSSSNTMSPPRQKARSDGPASITSASKSRTWKRREHGSKRRVPCTVPTREQRRWPSE